MEYSSRRHGKTFYEKMKLEAALDSGKTVLVVEPGRSFLITRQNGLTIINQPKKEIPKGIIDE